MRCGAVTSNVRSLERVDPNDMKDWSCGGSACAIVVISKLNRRQQLGGKVDGKPALYGIMIGSWATEYDLLEIQMVHQNVSSGPGNWSTTNDGALGCGTEDG
jgi:hypothetical protein